MLCCCAKSTVIDDADFIISEEELRKIDEEVNKKYLEVSTNGYDTAEPLTRNESTIQTALPDFSSIDNFQFETIEVSNEYMAMFDALEQQAYIATQAGVSSPTTKAAVASENNAFANMSDLTTSAITFQSSALTTATTLPLYGNSTTADPIATSKIDPSAGTFHIDQRNETLFCIRLRAIEVREDSRMRKKVIISQLDESILPANKHNSLYGDTNHIFVELEHTW